MLCGMTIYALTSRDTIPTGSDTPMSQGNHPRGLALGACIRRRRGELGVTQADLADRVGVTTRTLSAWEHGSNPPLATALARLGTVMGGRFEDHGAAGWVFVRDGVPDVQDGPQGRAVVVLPEDALDTLTPSERAEVRAYALAMALQRAREIRASQGR